MLIHSFIYFVSSNQESQQGRFVTVVKLNKGLKTSNYDQLYAYLKQHETHANKNKMMLERYTQHAIDPPAFVSNVSLKQTSSNTRNQATVQNDRVVVQNVQGRQNRVHGNNARGAIAAGNGGVQNRVGNANPGQAKPIKCYNCNGIGQLLFIAGGHDNTFNDDVDEAPTMYMANLSSADPIYDEAGLSYDSDLLSKAAQCISTNEQNKVVNESLTAALARYKEQVEIYEKRARSELTEKEQRLMNN
ncbi:hypothetical protein Tco_0309193 [Tanacetum coccineum]